MLNESQAHEAIENAESNEEKHGEIQELKAVDGNKPSFHRVATESLSFADMQHYQLVYNKSAIQGPYNTEQIAYKFLRREISGIIWIRECEYNAKWYQLDLDELKKQNGILCNDLTFRIRNDNLEKTLKKAKQLNIWYTKQYPNDNEEIGYGWNIFNMILVIFMALHGNVGLIFVFISLKCYIQNKCYFVFARIVWTLICISTSVCVVYFGFLYNGIYDEIQSWMIGYIGWISITQIQWISDSIMQLFKYEKGKQKLSNLRMKTLGIKLSVKKDLFKDWKRDFWIVPVSSLFPAFIIGFLANYFLEEEFLLKCSAKYENGDICYENDTGCCQVISSFNVLNIYDFLGKLASNILATYGLIRVIAWYMVKKHKNLQYITQKRR